MQRWEFKEDHAAFEKNKRDWQKCIKWSQIYSYCLILKSNLVLLHDIKLNNMHTLKLTWRWLRFFQIMKMNIEKEWYKIAELDEAILKEMIAENKLKKCVNWALKSEISNKQKNEDQNLLITTFIEKIVSEIAINVSIRNLNASLNFIHY